MISKMNKIQIYFILFLEIDIGSICLGDGCSDYTAAAAADFTVISWIDL